MPVQAADTGPDIVTAWTGFAPAAALLTSTRPIEEVGPVRSWNRSPGHGAMAASRSVCNVRNRGSYHWEKVTWRSLFAPDTDSPDIPSSTEKGHGE